MYRLVAALSAALAAIGSMGGGATARPIDFYCSQDQALGTSRIQVVDATGGPRFGRQFEADGTSFLQPGEVVLTFDDGPYSLSTGSILDTLDRYCVKATFFAVGRMAIAQPTTMRAVAARGHTVAGHTWGHANLGKLSAIRRAAEVEKGFSALTQVVGPGVAPFFRFPYLASPKDELARLAQRNVAVFGIDVDSTDSHSQLVPPARIVARTLAGLKERGKGVILLHDLKTSTASALPDLLKGLKENGYRIVHIVPGSTFEPDAASTAEVAAVMTRRNKKAAGTVAVKARQATSKSDVTGKAPRNAGKPAVAERKSKPKHKKPAETEAKNGPFRRI